LLVSRTTAGIRSWMFFNIRLYSGLVTVNAVLMLPRIRSLFKIVSPVCYIVFYRPPWSDEQAAKVTLVASKSPKSVALPVVAIVMY